jgi:hypothetical protein
MSYYNIWLLAFSYKSVEILFPNSHGFFNFLYEEHLHAPRRFRQPRQFAGSLGRPRGKEFVELLQVDPQILADHRGDAELLKVVRQIVDDLPMFFRQCSLDLFGTGVSLGELLTPLVQLLKEAILIHFICFPGQFDLIPGTPKF